MSEAIYMLDCYKKEFEATVVSVKDDKYVVLDKTAFYPTSGGQPCDTGKFFAEDGTEYDVVFVGKFDGQISHEVDKPGLAVGDILRGVIDWDRRYQHMRMHTAAHIIANVIEKEAGAKITGNQLAMDKSRIDFSLENFDREKFTEYEAMANKIIQEAHPIKLYLMPRAEAEKRLERFTTLAKGFPETIKEVRLVEIENFTIEACGGTHLANTGEVKGMKIVKMENKGKDNRRMYFELCD